MNALPNAFHPRTVEIYMERSLRKRPRIQADSETKPINTDRQFFQPE
jgi:hypothetical protein